jgi:hypothetical protein
MTSGIGLIARPEAPQFIELEDLSRSVNSSPKLVSIIGTDSYRKRFGLGGLNGIN